MILKSRFNFKSFTLFYNGFITFSASKISKTGHRSNALFKNEKISEVKSAEVSEVLAPKCRTILLKLVIRRVLVISLWPLVTLRTVQ